MFRGLSVDEQKVSCPVCLEPFQKPKSLKCGHLLCTPCMERLLQQNRDGTVQCTICRAASHRRDIRPDYTMEEFVSTFRQKSAIPLLTQPKSKSQYLCEACTKKSCSSKCQECNQMLCDGCAKTHVTYKVSRQHTILTKEQIKAKTKEALQHFADGFRDMQQELQANNQSLVETEQNIVHAATATKRDIDEFLGRVQSKCAELSRQIDRAQQREIASLKPVKDSYGDIMKDIETNIDFLVKLSNDIDKASLSNPEFLNDMSSQIDFSKLHHKEMLRMFSQMPVGHRIEFYKPAGLDSQVAQMQVIMSAPTPTWAAGQGMGNQPQTAPRNQQKPLYPVLESSVVSPTAPSFHIMQQGTSKQGSSKAVVHIPHHGQVMSKPLQTAPPIRPRGRIHSAPALITKKTATSLKKLGDKKLSPVKQVKLTSEPHAIHVIGDNLWCVQDEGINVYNSAVEIRRSVTASELRDGWRDVDELPTGELVIAASQGLYHLSSSGDMLATIDRGHFTGVQYNSEHIYAAESGSHTVRVYDCQTWHQRHAIVLPCRKPNHFLSLSVRANRVAVCCRDDHQIYCYSLAGDLLATHGEGGWGKAGKLDRPFLCDEDDDGRLLVADKDNDRLQILDAHGQWKVVQLRKSVDKPRDAVFWENLLFIVTSSFQNQKIHVYACK